MATIPEKLNDCFFCLCIAFSRIPEICFLASTFEHLVRIRPCRGPELGKSFPPRGGAATYRDELAMNMPGFFPVFATEKHCRAG
jgi:hypothetical protein